MIYSLTLEIRRTEIHILKFYLFEMIVREVELLKMMQGEKGCSWNGGCHKECCKRGPVQ
jgi:hypothetical protein